MGGDTVVSRSLLTTSRCIGRGESPTWNVPVRNPNLLNPSIKMDTTTTNKKYLTAEHNGVWAKYYLQEAVEHHGVETVVKNVNEQDMSDLLEDYA